MTSRAPIQLIDSALATTTTVNYTVPGANVAASESPAVTVTINAASANNTSAAPVAITVYKVPPSGSEAAATEIVSGLVVPATGSAPALISALVGQHLRQGWKLSAKAVTGAVVNLTVQGYIWTP